MDTDDTWDSITSALGKLAARSPHGAAQVRAMREVLERIVEILVARGALNEGHRRLLGILADKIQRAEPPRVRLKVHAPDKYTVPNSDIDCAALMHLCHGRCCSLRFDLTPQDIEEGVVRWELDEPYVIRHGADERCVHQDRTRGGCTVYDHRPATCRQYDCRQDARVWTDFDNLVPAPLPEGVGPLSSGGRQP